MQRGRKRSAEGAQSDGAQRKRRFGGVSARAVGAEATDTKRVQRGWGGGEGADLGVLAAPLLDQFGVDVDGAHVVDDGADLQAFRVGEEVLQQRGLPCAEEAREDGHRDRLLLHDCLLAVRGSLISAGSDAGGRPVPACVHGLTRHARGRGGDEEREWQVKQLE